MVRRSFVSIYFLNSQFQLVILSGSKKKVQKYTTIDLPEGLILNHEVQDPKLLGEILKKVWAKYKIKEKSVGIVVPEFSTFTKSFNLPDLAEDELDEAVRWQSLDYIPLNQNEMVLDWKVIKRTEASVQVLAVAIKDNILKGYVDATALAGLYPLVVETPSISLTRISGEKGEKIIIFFSFDEVIIVLADGQSIISSSVLHSSASAQDIVRTSQRMTAHYQDISIKEVYLGGVISSQEIVNQVVTGLNLKAVKIGIKEISFNDSELQKYLIPISLQFKDPAEPSSSETINLLPGAVVSKYEKKRLSVQLWSLMMITTVIIVVSFLALLGSYMYIIQNQSFYNNKNESEVATYGKNKDALEQIKTINLSSDRVKSIFNLMLYPQDVLNLVKSADQEGIRVINYKIDFEKRTALIQGVASTRDNLLDFKTSLEKMEGISEVKLPLSSFEKETDLEFNISFTFLRQKK
ncbi:MAG TPA: pilus assembly protein PilM [Patescibacteria group bacterium]|nr:pilus assembly protein PilM [Patescibacteria group bacterium]